MKSEIIRVGLVGYGLAGASFHAPLIRACERMELTAVLTSRDAPKRVDSLERLIEESDLVVIASPNASHFPIAKQALEARRHVVVDKPFTVTVDQADELIGIADRKEIMLSVFHNRRWDSDYLTVKDLMPQLGEVFLFEAHWDRFRPAIKQGWREAPERGSGVLSDLGPHLIDQALQLFGMPEAIEADLLAQREGAAVDDYFDLTLHYGRSRVCLRSSTLVASPRARFAIHGSGGSFVKYGLDPQETQLRSGMDPLVASFGNDPNHGIFTHPDGRAERVSSKRGHYLRYYEAMAAAILDGTEVPVTAGDARAGLVLIDLARDAARQGRRLPVPASSSRAV